MKYLTLGTDSKSSAAVRESLPESEILYRTLVEAAPYAIILHQGARILCANHLAVKLCGAENLKELQTKTAIDLIHPEYHQSYIERKKRLESGETLEPMEAKLVRLDGRTVPVETVAVTVEFGKSTVFQVTLLDITERKRVEEELRKKQEDLNRAQAVAKTGSWRMDIQHNRLLWSDETYRMFNIPRGTPLTYEAFLNCVHPEDRQYVDRKWTAALKGEPYDIEHRIIAGGEIKWVRERAELECEQGMLLGGFGTVQDITDLKQAEEAVRASTKKTDTVLASITDMYVSYDNEWRFVDLNPLAEKLMGKPRRELIGRVLWDLFPQLKGTDIHENYLKAVRDKSGGCFESYSPVTRHWHEFYLYPAEDGLSVYLRDISDRKEMEQALKASRDELELKVQERTRELSESNKALQAEMEARQCITEDLRKSEEAYRMLVESNPVGVFRLSYDPVKQESKRLHCNDAHLRILGYTSLAEYLDDRTPDVFHSEKDRKECREYLLKDGKVINYRVQMKRQNGGRLWVLLNSTVRNYNGQTIIEGSMTDISNQVRIEERLRLAQKNLRAMASEVILAEERSRKHFATDLHDTVVQTLGVAKLRSQLIQDSIPEEARNSFSELQDMLSRSITEARSIMAEMSPPVLNELGLVPALEWITEQIGSQHGIDVNFKTNNETVALAHEMEVLLFQATRELLMNVVKHANANSATVKFSRDAGKVRIEVKDDGTGFDIRKTFQPDMKGGFGLYSIRERLRHIGGTLSIKSKPGQGATVLIVAPAKK